MPQQLIYTSAPRGIVAGRSGYCTVARSALMREALSLQLEKFSYYQHLSLTGGRDRPIFATRIVDIRGTRFHVLSRIQDAGLDFTGRTNFTAHHLVFTPEEIRRQALPPVILRDWPGWVQAWGKEPQLLQDEDWAGLAALTRRAVVPAQTWERVTGDAVNGCGLLEARAGAAFQADGLTEETVLALFAESLALLEIRDPRRDCRTAAWNYTFTTSLQERDNPADFGWRCFHSDNPAANRLAAPDSRALAAVRALKWTDEEGAFARTGRQAPCFAVEPQDLQITEGQSARLIARAEGVPQPSCQWFSVDRADRAQVLPGETKPELLIASPGRGLARYRVSATNSAGTVQSRVVRLSVDETARLAEARPAGPRAAKPDSPLKSAADIDQQRRRLEADKVADELQQRRRRRMILMVTGIALAVLGVCGVLGWFEHWGPFKTMGTLSATNDSAPASIHSQPAQVPQASAAAGETLTNQASTNRPAAVSTLFDHNSPATNPVHANSTLSLENAATNPLH
jgi:hypothetical protein